MATTIRCWRPLGALTLLAALLLLSAPAADATSLTRIAPTARPGEFEFRAEGFRPGEAVSIRLTGPSGQTVKIPRDRANNRGRTSFKVFMPRHFQPGRWTITLRGDDSDRDAEGRFELDLRLH